MRRGNLYIPGGSDEAAAIFRRLSGGGPESRRGSVIIDSGAFYSDGTGEEGAIVSTSGLSSIEEISTGDMQAVAGAGTLVSDLKKAAEDKGLFFPAGNICSHGITLAQLIDEGCVLDLRRVYGGVREYILSMELVTAGGQLINSGSRAVKDVAGYDLIGFCFGSLGRCGLISRVVMRLLPAPRLREVIFYSGSIEGLGSVSLEINREAGPVCQYLFFDRAASMISKIHAGSSFEPGKAEAVLAVRVEAESERGRAVTVNRLDRITKRAGMKRLFDSPGEVRMSGLPARALSVDNRYKSVLCISFDTVPDFKRSLRGIVWHDLCPGRFHLMMPLDGGEPVGLEGAGECGRDIIRAMKQGLNSLRIELLGPEGLRFPLGTRYLRNILTGESESVTAEQLLRSVDTPFSLRESLNKMAEEQSPAHQNEVDKIETEIYRLFDPGSVVLER